MDETRQKLVGHKIKTATEIAAVLGPRPRTQAVIMCHGTFDIVHPGHIRHLLYAKSKGDVLVASLTADAHVTKANVRPYVPQELRALNLAALEAVNFVLIDPHPTPLRNIGIIQPDYFAKGYEYHRNGLHPRTQEEKAAVEAYGGELILTPGDIVFSSSQIIDEGAPVLAAEKLALTLEAQGLTFDVLRQALQQPAGIRVHLIGDTIVDSYTHCSVNGGITKTPTISVRFEEQRDFVGGSGIVAKHLKSAGADVTFSTVLGEDPLGDFAANDLTAAGVECLSIRDHTRPTTNKNVMIAGGYHLLQVDRVDNRTISEPAVRTLIERIHDIPADIVIFSDFRHGVFSAGTIPSLIAAIPDDVFRVADSQVASRWGNILDFRGFDLITPNEHEARFALGDQDSIARRLGLKLYDMAQCATLILKLRERGLLTFVGSADADADQRTFFPLDSFAQDVVDTVGAGDALLAYAALGIFRSHHPLIGSVLGSLAAAVECQHEGNVRVHPRAVLGKLDGVERRARCR